MAWPAGLAPSVFPFLTISLYFRPFSYLRLAAGFAGCCSGVQAQVTVALLAISVRLVRLPFLS